MNINKNFDEKAETLKHLGDVLPSVERFGADEQIICQKCGRKVPPTRENCLYCGAEIAVPEELRRFVRPLKQDLEDWEKGWNVCVAPFDGEISAADERFLTATLGLEAEILSNVLKSQTFLPISRFADERNAQIAVERLRDAGITAYLVADESLQGSVLPKRARYLSLEGDKCFVEQILNDEQISFDWREVNLFVVGYFFENEMSVVDSTAKKPKKEETEISEFSEFEDVLDIYTPHFPEGIRIAANHFDFSALGARKKLTARENFREMLAVVREHAPEAIFNDSYKTNKKEIGRVWLPAQKHDSKGLVRKQVGKFVKDSRVTTDNTAQFTKFSRMNNLLSAKLSEKFAESVREEVTAESYEQNEPPSIL